MSNADLNTEGVVFNVQRYSIHDGPGIRTTVFLKGCPLRCYWCQNPESQRIKPEVMYNPDACTGCGACAAVCPQGANTIVDGKAVIDRSLCTGCGLCIRKCRVKARSLQGKVMTVGQVMETVMKDKKEYIKSGGGLTLSGGEATMQSKFSIELLKAAKENGLHTAMETCGETQWKILEEMLGYLDYLFYDFKAMDSEIHKEGVGVGNELIIENAVKAAAYCQEHGIFMHVRTPLIPGYNDSREQIREMAEFINNTMKLPLKDGHYSILRYNKYAEGKYDRLGRDVLKHHEPQTPEYMDELNAIINSF